MIPQLAAYDRYVRCLRDFGPNDPRTVDALRRWHKLVYFPELKGQPS